MGPAEMPSEHSEAQGSPAARHTANGAARSPSASGQGRAQAKQEHDSQQQAF